MMIEAGRITHADRTWAVRDVESGITTSAKRLELAMQRMP